ncbi:MAG: Mov34/MPN/PAD-1 family protein [Lentisphaerae bacterium]|nr:Mov34/MPN/PAD-1 family protein [Lentisphaerota bacterium]
MNTPVYLKETDNEPMPDDPVSYLLTGDGLYINRRTPLFSASVPCSRPREFAGHAAALDWKQPIPQEPAEKVVGFFHMINLRHTGAEAVVLLGWTPERGYEVIVPEQTSIIARHAFGPPSPVKVRYEIPALPAGMLLVGDIHSHAYLEAFESHTDSWDMRHRAGLHLVVGRLDVPAEPPDFFAVVMVDNYRLVVEHPLSLFTDYKHRCTDIPEDWFSRVRVQEVPIYSFYNPAADADTWKGGWVHEG